MAKEAQQQLKDSGEKFWFLPGPFPGIPENKGWTRITALERSSLSTADVWQAIETDKYTEADFKTYAKMDCNTLRFDPIEPAAKAFIPPVALLLLGTLSGWVFSGFRK